MYHLLENRGRENLSRPSARARAHTNVGIFISIPEINFYFKMYSIRRNFKYFQIIIIIEIQYIMRIFPTPNLNPFIYDRWFARALSIFTFILYHVSESTKYNYSYEYI